MAKIIIFMFVLLITTACGTNDNAEITINRTPTLYPVSAVFSQVLDDALYRRQGLEMPGNEQILAVTTGRAATTERHAFNWSAPRIPSTSRTSLIADVEFFFNFIQTHYGAYIYFGGDDAFIPVRDTIINMIQNEDIQCKYVAAYLLSYQLRSVINDIHFEIESHRIASPYHFYSSYRRFNRTDNRFYCALSGLYIDSLRLANAYLLPEVFRFSMDENGETFFYSMVIVQPHTNSPADYIHVLITYQNNAYEYVSLSLLNQYNRGWVHNVDLSRENNIPVLTMWAMGNYLAPDDARFGGAEALQFLSYADELAGEPIIIVDLRGNGGGNANLTFLWLYRFFGVHVPRNYLRIVSHPYHEYDESLFDYGAVWEKLDNFHSINIQPSYEFVLSDTLFILLIDRDTASSAEDFANRLFSVENTLIIGQNSRGALLTGSYSNWLFTPITGIRFVLGPWFNIFPDGHFREGVGFAPDIWVHGCALTAALGMIEHHLQR